MRSGSCRRCRDNQACFDGPDWHHCIVCPPHDSSRALKPAFAASISEPDKDNVSYCGYNRHRHVSQEEAVNLSPDVGLSRSVIQGEARHGHLHFHQPWRHTWLGLRLVGLTSSGWSYSEIERRTILPFSPVPRGEALSGLRMPSKDSNVEVTQ